MLFFLKRAEDDERRVWLFVQVWARVSRSLHFFFIPSPKRVSRGGGGLADRRSSRASDAIMSLMAAFPSFPPSPAFVDPRQDADGFC